jgi:DNA-binding transcriptional LysR family regulator
MELRHLQYFVAVAEELHFSRAARRLHVAQPPLTRQIQALEGELGVRLFERNKRRVELTAAGRVFLDGARRVLEQAEQTVTAALRAGRGATGRLTVAFVGSATYGLLPEILRVFRRRFPDVELVLHELGSTAQQEAVIEGRLNIGFIRPAPEALAVRDPALAQTVVQRDRLMIALPVQHELARLDEVPLGTIAAEPFILFPRETRPSYGDLVLDACAKAGFAPRVAQYTQELQTAISLVAAGIGVTLVPSSVLSMKRANVVFKSIAEPTPVSELIAVHRKDDASPVLRSFLDVIGRVIDAGPLGDASA